MDNEERIRQWEARRSAGGRPGKEAPATSNVRPIHAAQSNVSDPTGVSVNDARTLIIDRREGQRRSFLKRMAMFIAAPLAAIGLYIALIATPLYEGEAVFTVQTGATAASSPTAGIFAIGAGSSTIADAFKARAFILSRPMMDHMNRKYAFLSHFGSDHMDPLTRYEGWFGMNRDPFEYYLKRVAVSVDVQEGILRLKVQARSKEDAVRFGNAILAAAEAHVNASSEKIGNDQIDALARDVQKAELQVAQSRQSLATVQAKRGDFNPTQTATAIYQLISNLELQLAESERQAQALRGEGLVNSPLLPGLDLRSRELRAQINEQRSRLTNPGGGSVARSFSEFENASSRKEIAQARWETTLGTLQQAYLQVLQQRRYFVIVVGMSSSAFAKVRDYLPIAIPILIMMGLAYAAYLGLRAAGALRGHNRYDEPEAATTA